jgi:hypothetical protein
VAKKCHPEKNLRCFCHPEKNRVDFIGYPSIHFSGCRLNGRIYLSPRAYSHFWTNFGNSVHSDIHCEEEYLKKEQMEVRKRRKSES